MIKLEDLNYFVEICYLEVLLEYLVYYIDEIFEEKYEEKLENIIIL